MFDPNTVEVKENKLTGELEVSSDKFDTPFQIYKTQDNTPFFGIRNTKGPTHESLSGHYSRPEIALQALKLYIRNHRGSVKARGDQLAKLREERKNGSEHSSAAESDLQQGADN